MGYPVWRHIFNRSFLLELVMQSALLSSTHSLSHLGIYYLHWVSWTDGRKWADMRPEVTTKGLTWFQMTDWAIDILKIIFIFFKTARSDWRNIHAANCDIYAFIRVGDLTFSRSKFTLEFITFRVMGFFPYTSIPPPKDLSRPLWTAVYPFIYISEMKTVRFGEQIEREDRELKSTEFLRQHLCIEIQRVNAASGLGMISRAKALDEIFYVS